MIRHQETQRIWTKKWIRYSPCLNPINLISLDLRKTILRVNRKVVTMKENLRVVSNIYSYLSILRNERISDAATNFLWEGFKSWIYPQKTWILWKVRSAENLYIHPHFFNEIWWLGEGFSLLSLHWLMYHMITGKNHFI